MQLFHEKKLEGTKRKQRQIREVSVCLEGEIHEDGEGEEKKRKPATRSKIGQVQRIIQNSHHKEEENR